MPSKANHWNLAQLFLCRPAIAELNLTDEDSGDDGRGIENMNTYKLEDGFELVNLTSEDKEMRLTNAVEEDDAIRADRA